MEIFPGGNERQIISVLLSVQTIFSSSIFLKTIYYMSTNNSFGLLCSFCKRCFS